LVVIKKAEGTTTGFDKSIPFKSENGAVKMQRELKYNVNKTILTALAVPFLLLTAFLVA
jgi:hypothetical protein